MAERMITMCKILAFNNLSQINKTDFLKLVDVANTTLTKTERDGFGYAAQGMKGVFGERTTQPELFESRLNGDQPRSFQVKAEQNCYGKYTKNSGPAIFHGRTSTNSKSLMNTHPFVKDDIHLIHNGVVNFDLTYDKKSTCDSEDLLEAYLLNKESLEYVETAITGYYAVALIENQELRIFKDARANLYSSFVHTINSFVFGTTKEVITNTCRAMKWQHSKIRAVSDNVYFGLDNGNRDLFRKTIKPQEKVYQYAESQSKLSLGYDKYEQWDFAKAKVSTIAEAKSEIKWSHRSRDRASYSQTYGYDDTDDYTKYYTQYVHQITGDAIYGDEYGTLPIDEKREYQRMVD